LQFMFQQTPETVNKKHYAKKKFKKMLKYTRKM
jgi:hypothetical protein